MLGPIPGVGDTDPAVAQDYERVAEYAKERSDLEEIVGVYRNYKGASEELAETQTLLTKKYASTPRINGGKEVRRSRALSDATPPKAL